MHKRKEVGKDESAGIYLSGILVVAIVAIAFAGILVGVKIDTFGLISICGGVFVATLFFPNIYALVPGAILIAFGLLLYFDVIGIPLPFFGEVPEDTGGIEYMMGLIA